MTQKETIFKEHVMTYFKALPNVWVLKTQMVATRGIPDLLLCVRGKFIAIELKRSSSQEPDPLQQYNLQQIKKAGGRSYWCHPENWVRVKREIRNLAKGIKDAD